MLFIICHVNGWTCCLFYSVCQKCVMQRLAKVQLVNHLNSEILLLMQCAEAYLREFILSHHRCHAVLSTESYLRYFYLRYFYLRYFMGYLFSQIFPSKYQIFLIMKLDNFGIKFSCSLMEFLGLLCLLITKCFNGQLEKLKLEGDMVLVLLIFPKTV